MCHRLKLGSKGAVSVGKENNKKISFSIPSFAKNVLDAVGAGDALLAYSSLSMFKSKWSQFLFICVVVTFIYSILYTHPLIHLHIL